MYGTKYILAFSNDLGELYEIYFDFLGYTGTPSPIKGSGDVLTLRSTGGDESKMEPILGTEALIDIYVDINTPITIADLVAAHDNDIRVTVFKDKNYGTSIFQGFIVVEDNSQPFQDAPFTLSVRALDGLGLLKGVDLVDTNALLFAGAYSVLSWICQILYKTDQTLNLRVFFNIFEKSFMTNVNPLEQTFLHSITFSKGDSFNSNSLDPSVDSAALAADDCYTALEKIVRCFRCRLFQEDGRWNLVSLYEYLNPSGYSYTEYSLGDPVNGIVPFTAVDSAKAQTFDVQVGKDGIVHPIQDDQNIYLKIATKWIKLTYSYDQSQNKVCNQDLSDTSVPTRQPADDENIQSQIIDVTLNPTDETKLLTTQAYQPYCFTHSNGNWFDSTNQYPYPANSPTAPGFIRVVIDDLGYELLRFLVLKAPAIDNVTYFKTSRLLIDTSDILQLTFSYRTRVNTVSGTQRITVAWILLYGDDGTFWAMESFDDGNVSGNPTRWKQTDSDFRNIGGFGTEPVTTPSVTDSTQWIGVSANNNSVNQNQGFAKAPVSGQVEILFLWFGEAVLTEAWFKDISVTILPYLQGSYQQVKGDYNFSGSNNNIKQTEADDVEISDSPKRYFKGALLKANSDLLSISWNRYGVIESLRFTQLMERIMFTHLCRIVHKIEGTWKGLIYRPDNDISHDRPNGYLNGWLFADSMTPTKKYMLTSFEKNMGQGQWRGVFVETLNDQNDPGFASPDNYTFSYIFQ